MTNNTQPNQDSPGTPTGPDKRYQSSTESGAGKRVPWGKSNQDKAICPECSGTREIPFGRTPSGDVCTNAFHGSDSLLTNKPEQGMTPTNRSPNPKQEQKCPECSGYGWYVDDEKGHIKCPTCHGSGKAPSPQPQAGDSDPWPHEKLDDSFDDELDAAVADFLKRAVPELYAYFIDNDENEAEVMRQRIRASHHSTLAQQKREARDKRKESLSIATSAIHAAQSKLRRKDGPNVDAAMQMLYKALEELAALTQLNTEDTQR